MSTSIPVLSVSQFLDITNEVLSTVEAVVQGEITSVTVSAKAVYFSLSDPKDKAVLKCMVWRNVLNSFGITLSEGMEVKVLGTPDIYKPYGTFSLKAKHISPVGEGALRQAFEQLKKQLTAAGYFNPERKKKLPRYPTTIGLITSERGAAINDFRTHLQTVGLQIQLFDALVQGPQAVASLVAGIEYFNQQPQAVDVIVITRGGGSLEDLQAFNSDILAKAIFASKIATISAVGHEDDISICDLVADVRASTPTAAAKLLCQHWQNASLELPRHSQQLIAAAELLVTRQRNRVTMYQKALPQHFSRLLEQEQQLLNSIRQELYNHSCGILDTFHAAVSRFSQLFTLWQHRHGQLQQQLTQQQQQVLTRFSFVLSRTKQGLAHQLEKLQLSDPQLKLKQGYAIVRTTTGRVLKTSAQAQLGDTIAIQLHQGQLQTQVTDITS